MASHHHPSANRADFPFHSPLFAVLGMLVTCTAALAISPEQARQQTELARRNLEAAERQLGDAVRTASLARDQRNDLERRRRDLPRIIDDARRNARTQEDKANTLEREIPAARAAVDRAADTVEGAKGPEREAKAAVDVATQGVATAKSNATAAFESGPEWQSATTSHASAQAKVDTATAATLERVGKSPDLLALQSTAANAEKQVQAMRERGVTGGDPQLVTASKTWIDAKNAVERRKTEALNADPAVTTARQQLVAATGHQRTLKLDFDKKLPSIPEVTAATSQLAMQQKNHQTAAAELRKAEVSLNSAKTEVERKTRGVGDARNEARRLQGEAERAQADLSRVDRDIANIERVLNDAENRVRSAERTRDDASRRYRAAQDAEARAIREAPKKK